MSNIIKSAMDLQNPPPFSAEELAELKALEAMPDSEIDCSDIPPLDDNFLKNAIRNPYYKPIKASNALPIDADVLGWFIKKGEDYQAKINAVLREFMIGEVNQGAH